MTRKRTKKVIALQVGEGKRWNGPVMGIDVHKEILAICIVSETNILLEEELTNSFKDITKLINWCHEYSVRSVAMEATSQYHLKILETLADAEIPTLLANPQQTAETQGKKTDKLDAQRIAIAHRDGRLKPSILALNEFFTFRRIMRSLYRFIQEEHKCKQRLHQIFHRYEFRGTQLFTGFLKSQWSLNLLVTTITTDKTIPELIDQYYPHQSSSQRASKQNLLTQLVQELEQLRQRLAPLDKIALGAEIAQLQVFQTLQNQNRQAYYALANQNPQFQRNFEILLSIPGVGPDTAAAVLAEVVDVSFFKRPQQLAKFAGLAPRVIQSGKKKHVTGKIHKGGNRFLRRALTLACTNIFARGDKNHPFYVFIRNKYQEKSAYWLAICAGARKLANLIWYLLQRQECWRPPTFAVKKVFQLLQKRLDHKITLP
jgi:transposase